MSINFRVLVSLKNGVRACFNLALVIHFNILFQGWATFLVSGPFVGRRSPSRAGLLDGSSSIYSTTTIARIALIGKQKKVYTLLRCPVFYRKCR